MQVVLFILLLMLELLPLRGTEDDVFLAAHNRSQREPAIEDEGHADSETAQTENEAWPAENTLFIECGKSKGQRFCRDFVN